MNEIERIKELLSTEKLKRKDLSKETGIAQDRWSDVINQRTKLRHEELEALGKLFPEYRIWLLTGEEFPEYGHISPMTKLAHNNYQGAGKA